MAPCTVGWGIDITQKSIFSDNYDVTHSESIDKIQFNAAKMILIGRFIKKWQTFEYRLLSDFAFLPELGDKMI